LGSVIALSNDTGGIAETYAYSPYGKVNQASSVENPYLFTGRRYDTETGLSYYRARYYDAEPGRFLQVDPIGYVGGINLYGYCLNDPVNLVDPYGYWGLPVFTPTRFFIRELHWRRNMANNDYENEADANANWGDPLPTWQSTTHQIGKGNENNVKYVSPDGRHEAVYWNGKLVTDPLNRGTFNVFGPDNTVGHGVFDVVPWILWGNSQDDPSSPFGRIDTLFKGYEAKEQATLCAK